METEAAVVEADFFIKALEEERKKLLACQESQGVKSCMECEKTIGCQVRLTYVNAVYQSMNKGEGGGFEF